ERVEPGVGALRRQSGSRCRRRSARQTRVEPGDGGRRPGPPVAARRCAADARRLAVPRAAMTPRTRRVLPLLIGALVGAAIARVAMRSPNGAGAGHAPAWLSSVFSGYTP